MPGGKKMTLTYEDFAQVEIRSGTVKKVELFTRAKKPAYKVWVDFGEPFGIKQTSAQITKNYSLEALPGCQVAGVLNIGTRNIAGFISEFLLLGFEDEQGQIVLISPTSKVPNGKKLM